MPSEWPRLLLEEVAASQPGAIAIGPFGSRLKTDAYTAAGVALIRGTNLAGSKFLAGEFVYVSEDTARGLGNANVRPWDLVFPHRGNIGSVGVVPEGVQRYALSTSLMKITLDRQRVDPLFLYYFFRSAQGQAELLKNASQVGTPGIATPLTSLRACKVPVPPIDEQVATAQVLSSLDDRVDLLRQTNVTLESIAQALFKSWFIDFDPVRAKAEGRELEGMSAAMASLFPTEFEESALGLVPKGWRPVAIRDVVAAVYDGPHATPPESSEGAVFLGIKNLSGTSLDLSEVRYISENDWPQWTRRVTPRMNDIVFSYEAALGLFALIPPSLRCCLGRRLALIRPMAEDGTPHFWFHQFVGGPFQRLLDKHTVHGATVNRIALKEFPSFTVMEPGREVRIAFESFAQPLWARIHANRALAMKLAEIRDSLLPRLISGKLRLPEAEEQLEGAIA